MPHRNSKRQTHSNLIEKLSSKKGGCGFDKHEIESLLMIHEKCSKADSKMNMKEFQYFFHDKFALNDDIMLDRVFKAFDKDGDGAINIEEWVQGMNTFLNGSVPDEDYMNFIFTVYDMKGDGYICKEEMIAFMKNCVTKQSEEEDKEESVKELVEMTLKNMDKDNDGKISYTDYCKVVSDCPILDQFCGKCIPDDKTKDKFRKLISSQ